MDNSMTRDMSLRDFTEDIFCDFEAVRPALGDLVPRDLAQEDLLTGRQQELIIDALIEADVKVARGMAYLDQAFPGHERTVDLNQLNVGDSLYCPLGQASGDYEEAEEELRSEQTSGFARARELGFMWTNNVYWNWSIKSLNRAWVRAYEARRAG